MEKREEYNIHCTVAKLRICAEGSGHELQLASALYANQLGLSRELAMEITAAFIGWQGITSCLHDPQLEAKLEADAEYAWRFDPESLPLVVVNGKRAPDFAPLLFVIILTGGSTDHPALDKLPPPNPAATFELTGGR